MNVPHAYCPDCGCNLTKDAPVTIGRLTVDPVLGASWDGVAVAATPAGRAIVFGLAKAAPRTLSRFHLLELAGSKAEDTKLADVQVWHLRKSLAAAGAPAGLIAVVWGIGYRLDVELAR